MRSRFGSEEKKGKGEGEIAMVRRGKDAMKESPRENKYEPAWMPKLIKEGKEREMYVVSILKGTQEELVSVASVRKESQWSLSKGKLGSIIEKDMEKSGEKKEGSRNNLKSKQGYGSERK